VSSCAVILQFARERFGSDLELRVSPLHGGLESPGIVRAVVHRRGAELGSFVAKPFSASGSRELDVYRVLRRTHENGTAPALLGWMHKDGGDGGYMFLEWVAGESSWPWRHLRASALVMDQLASVHEMNPARFTRVLTRSWDYERDLGNSARLTIEAYERAFSLGVRPGERPMLRTLERLYTALPRLRRELLAATGTALLHGDAHPGNVVYSAKRVLLLDWGRARLGSPLEDVASWVHSVGFWEPAARRKHDTLLKRYLSARGQSSVALSQSFRDACVLAGASNGLSGALRYHLAVIGDSTRSGQEKWDSYRAAADWLRILRRADACFR
jgi:aminoglycoside phosphotransferase (APT) family kinase protein